MTAGSPPGGRRRVGRLRELLVAGVVDSFGMALGWTVVVLMANARGGLAEAALYHAAMLVGVVLSAPVTGWLSHRMNGRALLSNAAGAELVLRAAVLGGLVLGAPSSVVAVGIVVMHVAAWAGFAGMRAEVSAVDASPRSMTRYAVSIAGVEASGTALAALLPKSATGYPTGWLLVAVFIVYLGSLLPTFLTARRARVAAGASTTTDAPRRTATASPLVPASTATTDAPRGATTASPLVPASTDTPPCATTASPLVPASTVIAYADSPLQSSLTIPPTSTEDPPPPRPPRALDHLRLPSPRLLLAGGAVMLLAAGPTLLAVPLTAELHGEAWVAGAAVAFSLGTLLSTTAVGLIGRLRLPAVLRWSLWGLGMLAGWILAPSFAPMILLAQFAAGLCQTAFEGDMDSRVAAGVRPSAVTRALAYSASVRALGGAVAVRSLPLLVAAPAIGTVASGAALALGTATLFIWAGLTLAPHIFRRLAH